MAAQNRTVEEIAAGIGFRAHGIVTRAELLAAGVSRHEIAHRLRTGALIQVYPGVYRVGHRAPSLEASYLAAVKACGKEALLNNTAAAYLYGLTRGQPPPPHVTTKTERRIAGITTRRERRLDRRDATTYRGIPITTVPRTLVDIAGDLRAEELARACHEAGVNYRTTPRQVERVLERRPGTKGAKKLRAVLRGETPVTLSALEKRFLKLLREANLPLPVTNRPAGTKRVDCRWADPPLTVELDSYRYHNSRHAWEQDRKREREARAREDEYRRYTYGDVFEEPRAMLTELRALLSPT